jgi:hypothetical protein
LVLDLPEGGGRTGSLPYGYNVRRQSLDPMLRRLAIGTEGVDGFVGHTVDRLITQGDRSGRRGGHH